jgi:LAGLIDADG-like domain
MRMVEGPRLPFNLATESGARLIGYQGDVNSHNSAFTNGDVILHEDFQKCVRDVIGSLTITRTEVMRGGFGYGRYLRTNVGFVVKRLIEVAGLKSSAHQKLANNPLPLWFHLCRNTVVAACLAALWDAEGSVNFHDVKVSQAVLVSSYSEESFPYWPANIPFNHLSSVTREGILAFPPNLLISASLLLRRFGIVSHLLPTKVSMTSTGPTAYWHLRINRIESIERFRRLIPLLSTEKRRSLQDAT